MTNYSEHPTSVAKTNERDAWNERIRAISAVEERLANAVDATRRRPVPARA